ncbi:histone deacetylase complex subunit SAP30L isoform X1 [Scyliorhinus torazame]|uniref:histone deacetylase complex subunit SAP30L isoform X1 n=1 Tax=Scyliorhinus torazame TaxID=75743 RepID=UPI003B5CB735
MNGFSTEEDSRDGGAGAPGFGHICCLVDDGERCNRPAGNASFSKRIQKSISQKKLKLETDKNVRHLYICDFHKGFIQSVRNKRKRKGSDDDGGDSPDHDAESPEFSLLLNDPLLELHALPAKPPFCHSPVIPLDELLPITHLIEYVKVDLFQLQVNTLRRYKRHFKLQTRPGLNKAQLAETISRHFRTIPVNEKETLAYFIYMVKNDKIRHDQKPDSSIH